MPASNYDLYVEQGATYRLPFLLRNDNGSPMDLTGCTAKMQVRLSEFSDVVLSLESPSEITITPLSGIVEIVITDENSFNLKYKHCIYDLFLYFPNGEVNKVAVGNIFVSFAITRSP